MIVSESNIQFEFPDCCQAIKFDDTEYYRKQFNILPNGKAVDFIAYSQKKYLLLEVKNCVGNEAENRWRIAPNNSKRDTCSTENDVSDRDSLDIEVVQKTASTLAALAAINTGPLPQKIVSECYSFAEEFFKNDIRLGKKELVVLLLLEGEFGSYTRNDNFVRRELRKSIEKKLKWLNCIVMVESISSLRTDKVGFTAKTLLNEVQ